MADRDVENCNESIEELEQYSRRNNIRILGMKKEPKEDADTVVLDLCKKIKAKVKLEDIDRAHRVGKYQEGSSRPMIVKFTSYRGKMEVIRHRRALREQGS